MYETLEHGWLDHATVPTLLGNAATHPVALLTGIYHSGPCGPATRTRTAKWHALPAPEANRQLTNAFANASSRNQVRPTASLGPNP